MGKHIDLAGMAFGKLTVTGLCDKLYKNRWRRWICQCECGNQTEVFTAKLRSGHTKSCGCLSTFTGRHLKTNTRLYRIWCKIKERCYNTNCSIYKYYGAIGIKLCPEWHDFNVFYTWAISNGYEPTLSIDRYPNKKVDYSPSNCRWATDIQQNRNSAHNVIISIGNETMCIADFAEKYGIKYSRLRDRVSRGHPLNEDILLKYKKTRTKPIKELVPDY